MNLMNEMFKAHALFNYSGFQRIDDLRLPRPNAHNFRFKECKIMCNFGTNKK